MTELTTFLDEWTDAERTADRDWLDAHLADDFVGVGPLGFSLPKPAWISRHDSGDLRYSTFDLDEVQVHEAAGATVVTARQDADGSFAGTPVPQVLRNTFVLTADGDDWQLRHLHMSFVAGTPGAPPIPGS
jgi:ketosteroid isomerase-like protein